MSTERSQRWVLAALLLGVVYVVIGQAFAAPAEHVRVWRLAAWVVSGIAYAAHLGYEHFTLRNSPRVAAIHVSLAVAIGAAGLALAGLIHSLSAASGVRPAWLLALVLWPVITAVPALLVALVAGAALAHLRR